MNKSELIPLYVLLVILLGVVGYLAWQNNTMRDEIRAERMQQVEYNKLIVAKFDSVASLKLNKIVERETRIKYYEKKASDEIETVSNVTNVDTAIVFYYRYRSLVPADSSK